jgi:hypothetical protein
MQVSPVSGEEQKRGFEGGGNTPLRRITERGLGAAQADSVSRERLPRG